MSSSTPKKIPARRPLPNAYETPSQAVSAPPSSSRIPARPRAPLPAPLNDRPAAAGRASSTEGGVRIPTFTEAQSAREQQFFATRKAEFDAVVERESIKERQGIEQIKEVITHEIRRLEQMNGQMNANLSNLQKLMLESGEKKGLYQIRFMELMLELLRTLSLQVSESNTWLEAMISKKKKRGSLFGARSKNQGTQYSMSQELSLTRAVQ